MKTLTELVTEVAELGLLDRVASIQFDASSGQLVKIDLYENRSSPMAKLTPEQQAQYDEELAYLAS